MNWKRTATGVVAVAALALTAFAVSASEPTSALADSGLQLTASPSGSVPSAPPRPFLSTGTGQTGGVLVTSSGQALYFNDQDTPAVTVCIATCALVWHPLVALANGAMSVGPDVIATLSSVRRPDGTMQVTYDGHALYTYTVDAAGHLTGNGLIDSYDGHAFSWHAVTASGQPLPGALPSTLPGTPGLPTPITPVPGTSTPTPRYTPPPAPAPGR